MLPRDFLRAALLTAVVVGAAQACPDHADQTTAQAARTPSQAALVAWKPRAWTPPAKAVPAASFGLRVARDPVDGTLTMPGPGDLGLEQAATAGERRPVAVWRKANGAVRAQLDESFHEYAVARMGPDGKPVWTCVSGPAEAERTLKAPLAPAQPVSTKGEDK